MNTLDAMGDLRDDGQRQTLTMHRCCSAFRNAERCGGCAILSSIGKPRAAFTVWQKALARRLWKLRMNGARGRARKIQKGSGVHTLFFYPNVGFPRADQHIFQDWYVHVFMFSG